MGFKFLPLKFHSNFNPDLNVIFKNFVDVLVNSSANVQVNHTLLCKCPDKL